MNEDRLLEKLQALEALHAGATTDGERFAAGEARRRIQQRLEALQAEAPPKEFKLTVSDPWSMKLLIALCRRYGIKPYRHKRQHRTTLMVRVSERFLDETLWPEFSELSQVLSEHLRQVTNDMIAKAIHDDTSDASEAEKSDGLLESVTHAHGISAVQRLEPLDQAHRRFSPHGRLTSGAPFWPQL